MKIAIMQPYLFPYLGYFQLINAVDTFVGYDDVNYIKGGWINRNNLLVQGKPSLFTISLESPSSFTPISETKIDSRKFALHKKKLLKTITQSYKKAPFYKEIYPLLEDFITTNNSLYIADFALDSVMLISNYLDINTTFKKSSVDYPDSKGLEKTTRLLDIIKKNGAQEYINPIGGQEIYDKAIFKSNGIILNFLKPQNSVYKQFDNDFVPWLSIIDVLMFNPREEIGAMLNKYELV